MTHYLPVVYFAIVALGILLLAGLGASGGNARGMLRYVGTWFGAAGLMVLVALVAWIIMSAIGIR
jgi:hypothetical protein